jgi:hypothetical protein
MKPFSKCFRAGLQHGSTSQPQDGAATSQPQLGAGAGAGSQQGAGAGAGSQQVGAVSQQEALRAWSLAINPLSKCLRAGLQHGSTSHPQDGAATSQPQDGAGAGSQHVGAASQQAALWKRPAEAVDEKLTAMAAIAREAIKRMDFSPKYQSKFP